MGKAKKTRKFAAVKRMMSPHDVRLKSVNEEAESKKAKAKQLAQARHIPQLPSHFFMSHNTALGPPYQVLVDTNFINFSIRNKLDIVKSMMDCTYAKCTPIITDCVMAELEKLGPKYRVALRIAKDRQFERLPCTHAGTYADDCLVRRVSMHRVYCVATNDKDLKQRIRKIPGVPIMYVANHKYKIERLPDAAR